VGNVSNDEVKHFLNAADLFLFSSTSETQGIVLAEAFATECPAIAVKGPGIDDIVESGYNGFTVTENPELWAKQICEALLAENLKRLQSNTRETAKHYMAGIIAKREVMFFRECICSCASQFHFQKNPCKMKIEYNEK